MAKMTKSDKMDAKSNGGLKGGAGHKDASPKGPKQPKPKKGKC